MWGVSYVVVEVKGNDKFNDYSLFFKLLLLNNLLQFSENI